MVDAFPIVDSHFSGVGHYTLGIIRGFDELASEGKLTYSLIVPKGLAGRIKPYQLRHYKKIIINPVSNRVLRGFMKYHWQVPMDLILGKGCYYFPSFLAWPLAHSRSSVVIHDVTYLAVPDCVEEGNRKYLTTAVPFSIKNATNVIAVSEFSKSELIKYYGLKKDKIVVAYPSIDRRLFYRRSAEEIHKIKAKYDIFSDKYILAVGNLEPRKNYSRLIKAYVKLPKSITDKYPLVIFGAGGWNNKDIMDLIQKAKEDGYHIINPKQYVPTCDMPALYSGAQFFIFISIYEGFGMSPLEAYACKTPVLASKIASIPESAGKAAMYVDPFDEQDILDKLKLMFKETEHNPHKFDDLIKERLDGLSWRKSAEITASALTGLPIKHFRSEK